MLLYRILKGVDLTNCGWKSLYYPLGTHFLDKENLTFIQSSLENFPLEDIIIGDAGEINNCQVGRLVEDLPGKIPNILNSHLSTPILNLYQSLQGQAFFKQFFTEEVGYVGIRRSQFNLLGEGSYVGRHLDIDSNPEYHIAAVLQLGSKFSGGEFAVYPNKRSTLKDAQLIKPEYGSLTISFCNQEHEVLTVEEGTRTSLVCFITSDANSLNNRKDHTPN